MDNRLRARIATFVSIIQAILFLGHFFIYETWRQFAPASAAGVILGLRIPLAILSVSFVSASLLSFRYYNFFVRTFYTLAAVWTGFLNFLFLAACACWIVYPVVRVSHLPIGRPAIAGTLFSLAILTSVWGLINASWVRLIRISVALPNLPDAWRGRVAALVTDTHLGHVRGRHFMSRIVARLARFQPDIIFIGGDLYDGTKVDLDRVIEPWKEISSRFSIYFVTGNHEEFGDPSRYCEAIERAGIRVLKSDKVIVDGLQILGVQYGHSVDPNSFRSVLEKAELDRNRASVLISHVPSHLNIPEECGVSLQLSGHTHGGQVFPFSWFTWRIFGEYTYGLKRFGEMLVYTSFGAGTWGPPLRVGTHAEIVLITFE
jgi:predicted MPP superfamily phosphohydrolase